MPPDSKVRVLRRVPLTSDYNDTIWFREPTETAADADTVRIRQRDFFLQYSFEAGTFDDYTFQRVEDGEIFIKGYYENFDGCNYIMIMNTQQNTRWYYGFINKITYVNNNTCKINYSLDVFQCYQEYFDFNQAYIERCHAANDELDSNLLADNVEIGELKFTKVQRLDFPRKPQFTYTGETDKRGRPVFQYQGWSIAVVYQLQSGSESYPFTWQNMKPSATFTKIATDSKELLSILEGLEPQNLQNIYMVPQEVSGIIQHDGYNYRGLYPWEQFQELSRPMDIDGYEPKNKKLLSYPYSSVQISNNQGGTMLLKWELSNDRTHNTIPLKFCCTIDEGAAPVVIPNYIEGFGQGGGWAAQSLSLPPFPQCSVNTDSYKAWLALNQGAVQNMEDSIYRSAITPIVSAVPAIAAAAAASNPATAAVTLAGAGISATLGAMSAANQANNVLEDKKMMPNQQKGSNNSWNLWSSGYYGFYAYYTQITADMAKRIDSYWTRFGYPQRKVMYINPATRPRFTFIKTCGCNVQDLAQTQGIPDWQKVAINKALDRGITFWRWNKIGTPTNSSMSDFSGNEV